MTGNKTVYLITCGAKDEDGVCGIGIDRIDNYFYNAEEATEQCCRFLSQTDETYVDDRGFIHEIYEGEDQVFGKYLDDIKESTIKELFKDLEETGQEKVTNVLKEIANNIIK